MPRDLVQRAMAHDHEAFSELARLSVDRLYAVARLILHDPELAEDAAQETLVAAWRDIATLRDPDRYEAWMRRLLVRTCFREARKEHKRHRMEVHVESIQLSRTQAPKSNAPASDARRTGPRPRLASGAYVVHASARGTSNDHPTSG
jgi:DNA-directed RNA polymerase specialized sigma24 family protein